MKITYDHYFGQMEKQSIQIYNVNLDCEPYEEGEALANGWLIYNNQWYQSRSTRINLAHYKNDIPINDLQYKIVTELNLEQYIKTYNIYCDFKQYPKIYDPFLESDRNVWMEFTHQDKHCGFTKFIKYVGGLESQFNAYMPNWTIEYGKIMLHHEISYAQSCGLNYLYIGSGYEKCSKYKAHISGFEWWTGSQWSGNKEKYIELCRRDSKIQTIKELCEISEP